MKKQSGEVFSKFFFYLYILVVPIVGIWLLIDWTIAAEVNELSTRIGLGVLAISIYAILFFRWGKLFLRKEQENSPKQ